MRTVPTACENVLMSSRKLRIDPALSSNPFGDRHQRVARRQIARVVVVRNGGRGHAESIACRRPSVTRFSARGRSSAITMKPVMRGVPNGTNHGATESAIGFCTPLYRFSIQSVACRTMYEVCGVAELLNAAQLAARLGDRRVPVVVVLNADLLVELAVRRRPRREHAHDDGVAVPHQVAADCIAGRLRSLKIRREQQMRRRQRAGRHDHGLAPPAPRLERPAIDADDLRDTASVGLELHHDGAGHERHAAALQHRNQRRRDVVLGVDGAREAVARAARHAGFCDRADAA